MACRFLLITAALLSCALATASLTVGCEDPPRGAPPPDPSSAPAPAAPPREGCARVGALEPIEADPTCSIRRVSDDAMRLSMKHLSIVLAVEPPEVVAGSMALLRLSIKNTASFETTVVFEARTRPAGPRTDWSRVLGVPEPRGASSESPRLFFPMTTTDAWDRDVDALPTIPGSAAPAPAPTTLAVHLRPGGKLTHHASWWALRIPAPAPIFQDDAGHRYVPKTAAVALAPGAYNVVVELPLYGLAREERKVSARVRVVGAPKLDGGD